MSDLARVTPHPGTCPKCGASKVVSIAMGDPDTPSETSAEGGITVMTHYQFLSCEACRHSWEPRKESA